MTRNRVAKSAINPDVFAIASETELGLIKVGNNLTIEADGTLHAEGGAIPDATLTEKGLVMLSSDTNSDSELVAATLKAIKSAKGEMMNAVAVDGKSVYGAYEDPNTTTSSLIITDHANAPFGSSFSYIHTLFYANKTGNRAQVAVSYIGPTRMMIRSFHSSVWQPWREVGVPTNYMNDAITIYVSNSGNDANTGLSTGVPVRTLAKAVELVKNLGAKQRVIQLTGGHTFNETLILKEIHGGSLTINGTYGNNAAVKNVEIEQCTTYISFIHMDVMAKGNIPTVGAYGYRILECQYVDIYAGNIVGTTMAVSVLESKVTVDSTSIRNTLGSVINTSNGCFVYVKGLTGSNPAGSASIYDAYGSIIIGDKGTITAPLAQRKGEGGQIFFT